MVRAHNKISLKFVSVVGSVMVASGILGAAPAIADDTSNLVFDSSVTAASPAYERESAAANLVSKINSDAGKSIVDVVGDAQSGIATIYLDPTHDYSQVNFELANIQGALYRYGFEEVGVIR